MSVQTRVRQERRKLPPWVIQLNHSLRTVSGWLSEARNQQPEHVFNYLSKSCCSMVATCLSWKDKWRHCKVEVSQGCRKRHADTMLTFSLFCSFLYSCFFTFYLKQGKERIEQERCSEVKVHEWVYCLLLQQLISRVIDAVLTPSVTVSWVVLVEWASKATDIIVLVSRNCMKYFLFHQSVFIHFFFLLVHSLLLFKALLLNNSILN